MKTQRPQRRGPHPALNHFSFPSFFYSHPRTSSYTQSWMGKHKVSSNVLQLNTVKGKKALKKRATTVFRENKSQIEKEKKLLHFYILVLLAIPKLRSLIFDLSWFSLNVTGFKRPLANTILRLIPVIYMFLSCSKLWILDHFSSSFQFPPSPPCPVLSLGVKNHLFYQSQGQFRQSWLSRKPRVYKSPHLTALSLWLRMKDRLR